MSPVHWTVTMWTVQGNQRWSQGLTMIKCLLRLHVGPGMALSCRDSQPTWLLLEHNCSCILHHWKLQREIKAIGLCVVCVFLGICVTGTGASSMLAKRLGSHQTHLNGLPKEMSCGSPGADLKTPALMPVPLNCRKHLKAKRGDAGR